MPRTKRSRMAMSPVHANAAAIDIGATLHIAAVGPDRDPEPVRSFGTFTGDLHRLADWFKQCGVSTVAMESTCVYWIPVFEILEQPAPARTAAGAAGTTPHDPIEGLPLEQDRARDGLQAHRGRAENLRCLDGHNQLPKLITGVKFVDGIEVVARSAAPQAKAA